MTLQEVSICDVEELKNKINDFLESFGMESYSFKLGWYNCKVNKAFQFPCDENTVAFCAISLPSMFEKTFIPYLTLKDINTSQDPLDQCMKYNLKKVETLLPDIKLEIIHDFELTPSRRPKILMQTAGHVSGAARYYQRLDLGDEDPWDEKKRIYGVSIHPKFGGWFAFRAIFILKNIICKDLEQQQPENKINKKEDLINLLTLFNDNWKDARYRDVISVKEKYSVLQKKYFDTLPSERHELIKSLLNQSTGNNEST